jgi:hypothetical protein
MAKQPTFTIPATESAASDRLNTLGRIMAANKPLLEQLEALLAAKDAYRTAEAEANAISAAMSDIRRADFAATVEAIRVLSIVPSNPDDESPIAGLTIEYEHRGQTVRASLQGADRAVYKAAAESGKLPVRVLKLADTPEAALERWLQGRQRGYLRG